MYWKEWDSRKKHKLDKYRIHEGTWENIKEAMNYHLERIYETEFVYIFLERRLQCVKLFLSNVNDWLFYLMWTSFFVN